MQDYRVRRHEELKKMERVMGIEPTSSAWEAEVLPLNNTREVLPLNYTHPGPRLFDYHSGADVAQQPTGISTIGTDPGVVFGSWFRTVGKPGLEFDRCHHESITRLSRDRSGVMSAGRAG